MTGTSICVVSRDRGRTLRQTLDALRGNLVGPTEIIVVDNGSTEEEAVAVLNNAEAEGARVIRNRVGLGLSVATNQGLDEGKYDTLIHLDDDALLLHQGWNQVMAGYLDRFPEVGLVVPYFGHEYIQREGYREIRWGLGFCWAYRRSLFEDIGGYDPQLYHQNECDLGLRVRMAGFDVAGITDVSPIHNDPGGPRSELSLAREHIGCVQYRDKHAGYHRGRKWNYGSLPLYLDQHWPPNQEWLRRFALAWGVDMNPPPERAPSTEPGEVLGITPFNRDALPGQLITLNGAQYLIFHELRNEFSHWQREGDGYLRDRDKAIERWYELTGERYEGYRWPVNLLRVRGFR